MSAKKTLVDRALAGLKAVKTGTRKRTITTEAASERAVSIPIVTVFSELPFAKVGVIGGDTTTKNVPSNAQFAKPRFTTSKNRSVNSKPGRSKTAKSKSAKRIKKAVAAKSAAKPKKRGS